LTRLDDKIVSISAVSGFNAALCKVAICPLLLNTLSELVLVAGTRKYFLQRVAMKGYLLSGLFHHFEKEMKLCLWLKRLALDLDVQ